MKCITLYRPWASWVVAGWKTIETRGHDRFRSLVGQRIAIHAGKVRDPQAVLLARRWLQTERCAGTAPHAGVAGAVIGTVFVRSYRWLAPSDEQEAMCPCDGSRFGLFLCEPEVLKTPLYLPGHQGIWEVELP